MWGGNLSKRRKASRRHRTCKLSCQLTRTVAAVLKISFFFRQLYNKTTSNEETEHVLLSLILMKRKLSYLCVQYRERLVRTSLQSARDVTFMLNTELESSPSLVNGVMLSALDG